MKQELRVWWNPQVGEVFTQFFVNVDTVEEGVKIMDVLADYDAYQYESNIKGDYANVGGLQLKEDGEWGDWWIESVDFGYYDDPKEYIEAQFKYVKDK